METLLKTPLHERQQALGSRNVGFCGWDMPIQYAGILAEHKACREDVALFDTSHMGEFFFEGDIVASGMNEATTIDIDALPVGKCKYGFLLNEAGGVIDDLIVYRLGERSLMIVVNAARREMDLYTFRDRLGSGRMEDRSVAYAKLDLQGPHAIKVLQPYVDTDLSAMGFFSFVQTALFGAPCLLSRTGYTGELGFELYLDAQTAVKIWDALIADGVTPAGLGARDVLRLEMGYSLYGNDLSETITPLEANLGMFVNLKRDYIGVDALRAQKEAGLTRLLMPFKTAGRRSARKDFEVYQHERKAGIVTSAVFSPTLQVGIGLAMIDLEGFDRDAAIALRDNRGTIEAHIASLPFITKQA